MATESAQQATMIILLKYFYILQSFELTREPCSDLRIYYTYKEILQVISIVILKFFMSQYPNMLTDEERGCFLY